MALLADFKARFPAIPTADADTYVPILENVWPEYYGKQYEGNEEIVLNLVAHLLVAEKDSGSSQSKSVESKSVGNVSVSYSASTQTGGPDYDFFRTTKYGQRYLILIKSSRGAYFV